MLVGEGGLEIKSGGEIGLKPYNASKGENLVEEWTELLKNSARGKTCNQSWCRACIKPRKICSIVL
jgi:hypothetical protein